MRERQCDEGVCATLDHGKHGKSTVFAAVGHCGCTEPALEQPTRSTETIIDTFEAPGQVHLFGRKELLQKDHHRGDSLSQADDHHSTIDHCIPQ